VFNIELNILVGKDETDIDSGMLDSWCYGIMSEQDAIKEAFLKLNRNTAVWKNSICACLLPRLACLSQIWLKCSTDTWW